MINVEKDLTVGELIKEARIRRKFTQRELADVLKVTEQTVGRWERDEFLPKSILISTISFVLNIPSQELLSKVVDENLLACPELDIESMLSKYRLSYYPNHTLPAKGYIGVQITEESDVMWYPVDELVQETFYEEFIKQQLNPQTWKNNYSIQTMNDLVLFINVQNVFKLYQVFSDKEHNHYEIETYSISDNSSSYLAEVFYKNDVMTDVFDCEYMGLEGLGNLLHGLHENGFMASPKVFMGEGAIEYINPNKIALITIPLNCVLEYFDIVKES